ncbi:hypothetical protein VIGAN_02318900, partial [Vigna angularis var. angularis]
LVSFFFPKLIWGFFFFLDRPGWVILSCLKGELLSFSCIQPSFRVAYEHSSLISFPLPIFILLLEQTNPQQFRSSCLCASLADHPILEKRVFGAWLTGGGNLARLWRGGGAVTTERWSSEVAATARWRLGPFFISSFFVFMFWVFFLTAMRRGEGAEERDESAAEMRQWRKGDVTDASDA